jgi:hypothetical protein
MNAKSKTIAFDLAMVLLLVICDYQHANSLGETISAFMTQRGLTVRLSITLSMRP